MRAADQPSAAGQNVSSAKTMPSSIVSGWSNETRRLKIGFSQIERPTPCPYWSANAASSSGKPNSCGLRPDGDDVRRRDAGLDEGDRLVEDVATALVGVDLRARGAPDGERAVVARAIAVEGVEDVEVGGVAGPQHAVGEDVRMRAAALARDGVHTLDVLGAELEEHLVDERDALVLAHPRLHGPEELLVGRVDHRAGRVQERDLVLGLDLADVLQEGLAVDDADPLGLQRLEHG